MFEPNNEMGVVVRFTQVCESLGYEIVSIQSGYPDAVSNFLHDPRNVNDLRDNEELSSNTISPIFEATDTEKELAYYRTENKYLRRQLDQKSTRSSDGDVAERITAFVYDIETREGRTPSSREVAAAIGCANSYAFTVMKMRESEGE